MVNQSEQKEQGTEKKDEMWVQDLPGPDFKDILTEETKDTSSTAKSEETKDAPKPENVKEWNVQPSQEDVS